jgi:chemotaxis protein MotB
MQKTNLWLLLGLMAWCLSACVSAKKYRTELAARSAIEAREKTLAVELYDRKKESADLIKQVTELSRENGRQEREITDLKTELASRTQSMGESSSKLANEKASLAKELGAAQDVIAQRNALIQKIKKAQDKRAAAIADVAKALSEAYMAQADKGISVVADAEAVVLNLPDKCLFEPTGLLISNDGKSTLEQLAYLLTARPNLDAEIVAYTDNILPPKEKTLKDTWEWSLQRATNVVRLLIREYNVNANQLTPVGRGEFYPVTSNETPEGRQRNRRTIIVIRPVLEQVPSAE